MDKILVTTVPAGKPLYRVDFWQNSAMLQDSLTNDVLSKRCQNLL